MTLGRTGALALIVLATLGVGWMVQARWPSQDPTLRCDAARIRWVDAGTGWVARCAEDVPGPSAPLPAGAQRAVGLKLDLNTVPEVELARLPGMGKSVARALVAARTRRAFVSWDEVDAVKGIGPARLRTLQALTALPH